MGNRWYQPKDSRYADRDYDGTKTDNYIVSRGDREESEETLWGWNIGALIAIFIPLFILFIGQLVQANKTGSRWTLWRGNDPGHVALWFAYIWSLLLFVGIIWYGNRMLTERASQNMRTLCGALFVFVNLCLIMAVIVKVFAVSYNSSIQI